MCTARSRPAKPRADRVFDTARNASHYAWAIAERAIDAKIDAVNLALGLTQSPGFIRAGFARLSRSASAMASASAHTAQTGLAAHLQVLQTGFDYQLLKLVDSGRLRAVRVARVGVQPGSV